MRLRFLRGRSLLVVALVSALAVPTAVSAASSAAGRKLPTVAAPTAGAATSGQSSEIFLVELEDGAQTFRNQARAVGLSYSERFAYKQLFKGLAVRIAAKDVGKLAGIGSVSNLYPARYYTLGPAASADPELATAIQMTGADLAQAAGYDGAGVKVAVMDTGIDLDHADLGGDGVAGVPHSNSRVIAQWDFVGDDYNADPEAPEYSPVPEPDPVADDCNGHGTHVAGIVGANGGGQAGHATGVAPAVAFGAYRVFGCEGSVTDDVMIAAMERALADGMHVLNMSIGDAFNNWAGSPTAAASDALVDAGMVVVASIGNSGANGVYSAGAPGVGNKVIGVASYDNSHVQISAFTISPDNTSIGYMPATAAPAPPTSGSFPMARTGSVASTNDACNAVAPPSGSLTGLVVLIRRGSCTFYEKSRNAQLAGAAGVVIYNNCPPNCGLFSGTVALQPAAGAPQIPIAIPVVTISDTQGALIDSRLAAGGVTMTWTAGTIGIVNPTGGLISSFSSYGTDAELGLKPDIGAPGGLIRSTWPLEQTGGGYATISGTSMASPHVAGAVALLKQARPSLPAGMIRSILQNSADPKDWFGAPGIGLLEPTHRQGAGMLDIDDAIASSTTIVPGKVSLGEGSGGQATLTLTNSGPSAVTYDLAHVPAVSTGTQTFGPLLSDYWLPDTQAAFSSSSVTVAAGGTASVGVTITADPNEPTAPDFIGFPTGGLYGGYLLFLDPGSGDTVFSVPYAGFKGDYQSIVAMPMAPVIGKLNPPFVNAQQIYSLAAPSEVWTLQSPDEIPNLLIHFNHQVRRLELQVVNAATGAPVHPVFSNYVERNFLARNGLQPPPGGPFNTNSTTDDVTAFPWDGTRMHDNGKGTADHRKVVPDGSYKIVVKGLKAGGNPGNAAHWETHTSPTITINRP